jgi:5-methyltetrahydrofolate--homocysteine methyltransferase
MGKVLDRIAEGKVLVSDGAWGTFLHQKGLGADECPESWNLKRPKDVLEIAQSYIDAGADIILTNSFGGSPFKLENYGLSEQTFEINKAAGEISRRAAGNKVLVLGSMGPTGKMVFMGEVPEDELFAGLLLQAEGLAAGGVDGIVIETMSDLLEASIAIKAVKSVTDLDLACTFTFELNQDGEYRSMMGTGIDEYLEMVQDAQVDIIGANCGNGTSGMIEIVKRIRANESSLPILIHANAGLPIYKNGETIFPETPADMAVQMSELVSAGANIVGGCCGTTPGHIRLICKHL